LLPSIFLVVVWHKKYKVVTANTTKGSRYIAPLLLYPSDILSCNHHHAPATSTQIINTVLGKPTKYQYDEWTMPKFKPEIPNYKCRPLPPPLHIPV
jgi:hypothetical protein